MSLQRSPQRTLKSALTLKGVGLHSGNLAQVTLLPSAVNSGVVFVRKDLRGEPEIRAHFFKVVNTQLATTLGEGPARVSTIEHLMATLLGLGIDNVRVEVTGAEVPILDGSSKAYVEAILGSGIATQNATRPLLLLKRKVEVKVGEKWAFAEPSPRFEVHGSIEFDHPSVGYQEYRYVEGQTEFQELCAARTFGFIHEVEALKRMGLIAGGSLDNAVVLDEAGVVNPDGLRYPDEFARHKVLDALGDFKLAGIHMQAKFRLHRAGHDLHSQLLAEIFRDPSCFEVSDPDAESEEQERRTGRVRAALQPAVASV